MTEPNSPPPAPFPRWVLPVMGAICCIVLIIALGLGLRSLKNSGLLLNSRNTTQQTDMQGNSSIRDRIEPSNLPYEESFDAPLEEGVKKVDYALLQALGSLALESSAIHLDAIELREKDGQEYHFQKMRVTTVEPMKLTDAIASSLITWAGNATLTKLTNSTYSISVNGVPTHELALMPDKPSQDEDTLPIPQPVPDSMVPPTTKPDTTPATRLVPDPHKTLKGSGHLAIVIDDLGESISAARKLTSLSYPVTFAIWPRATHTRQIAEIGTQRGEEIIIHQPMEPIGYPKVRPGPGTVFVHMTPDQIRTVLYENLRLVPEAVGINNHMGSRFTQDRTAVQAALKELHEHNLFVLDSWTHPKSILFDEAKTNGMTAYKRSVFIDVIRDVPSIVHQLEKAERIALTTGQAIAIGHPLPETLSALKEWEARRNPSVSVVTVRSLQPE